jgi:hypothetical protein
MAGRSRSTRQPGPWRVDQPPPRGNTLALRHGAFSERSIEQRASEIHGDLLAAAPWLSEPFLAPALLRYLRACAREQLAHEGILKAAESKGPEKIPTRLLEAATAAARLSAALAHELGLSPQGHAKLRAIAGTAAATEAALADLAEKGRSARQQAERRLARGECDSEGNDTP